MIDKLQGPFRMENSLAPAKLQEPTLRIKAADGTTAAAVSISGPDKVRDRITATFGEVLDALNGGAASDPGSPAMQALEQITSRKTTNVARAKEIARVALGKKEG